MASGEWRVASGEWRVASGEWRVASGEWRVNLGAAWITGRCIALERRMAECQEARWQMPDPGCQRVCLLW